jgi:hypothetical protein
LQGFNWLALSIGQPFLFHLINFQEHPAGRNSPSIYKDIIMPKEIGTYGSKRGRPPKKPKKGGISRGR